MKPSPEPPARPVIPDHQITRRIGEIWLAAQCHFEPLLKRASGDSSLRALLPGTSLHWPASASTAVAP